MIPKSILDNNLLAIAASLVIIGTSLWFIY